MAKQEELMSQKEAQDLASKFASQLAVCNSNLDNIESTLIDTKDEEVIATLEKIKTNSREENEKLQESIYQELKVISDKLKELQSDINSTGSDL